jgi:hypothetical protein
VNKVYPEGGGQRFVPTTHGTCHHIPKGSNSHSNPLAHTPLPPLVCARCTRTSMNTFLRLPLSKVGRGIYSGWHCIHVNTEEICHVWQQSLAQDKTRKIKHNRKLGNSRGFNATDTSKYAPYPARRFLQIKLTNCPFMLIRHPTGTGTALPVN